MTREVAVSVPRVADAAIQRALDLVVSGFNRVLKDAALVRAQILTDVELSTGTNLVNHGLGRDPIGVLVTPINNSASSGGTLLDVVWDRDATLSDRRLTLEASIACRATVVVF